MVGVSVSVPLLNQRHFITSQLVSLAGKCSFNTKLSLREPRYGCDFRMFRLPIN